MIKKFVKFAWNILNNEKGQIPWRTIAGIGGAILGGFGGSSKAPSTATQRIEQVRPTLTPEEQAMQNFFINQVYGRLGQTSPLQNLIQSYYGGGGYQSPYQAIQQVPGVMSGDIPSQYTPTPPRADQMPEDTRQQYEQVVKADRWLTEVLPALQKIKELYGGRTTDQSPPGKDIFSRGAKGIEAQEGLTNIAKQLGMTAQEASNLYNEWLGSPETVAQRYAIPEQETPIPPKLGAGPESVQALTQEGQPLVQMTQAQTPAQQYSPLTEIMKQSPEQLAGQYDILRQQGMKGIGDWYQQAARELEQRGIGTYGGYMGTPFQKDIGNILARRGEMESELGRQLGLSQLQAQQQLPYGQLQALEDVRRWEAQNLLAQQAPWIGVGQQMYALPWGQTTATTQQQPGVGIFPGAIGGALAGLSAYQTGANLGFWGNQQNQPATSYSTGLATPGLTLSGTQRAYEQFNPWG